MINDINTCCSSYKMKRLYEDFKEDYKFPNCGCSVTIVFYGVDYTKLSSREYLKYDWYERESEYQNLELKLKRIGFKNTFSDRHYLLVGLNKDSEFEEIQNFIDKTYKYTNIELELLDRNLSEIAEYILGKKSKKYAIIKIKGQ